MTDASPAPSEEMHGVSGASADRPDGDGVADEQLAAAERLADRDDAIGDLAAAFVQSVSGSKEDKNS